MSALQNAGTPASSVFGMLMCVCARIDFVSSSWIQRILVYCCEMFFLRVVGHPTLKRSFALFIIASNFNSIQYNVSAKTFCWIDLGMNQFSN